MSGRKPREAEKNFLRPLQLAVSCVTPARINVIERSPEVGDRRALTLGPQEPVRLQADRGLHLSVVMWFRIVEAEDERGPYKVETSDYLYSLADKHRQEIIAYHWHPHGKGPHVAPHLRLGYGARVQFEGLSDINLPSGRIALEQIIRLAIEMGAKPQRDDWDAVLRQGQTAFEQWRTWA